MSLINWEELLSAQHKLDLHTFKTKGLSYPLTRKKRLLALLVELNELANETKSFKFWMVNPEGDKNKVLEEYVDVLHFSLSIACDRKINLSGITSSDNVHAEDCDFVSEFLLKLNVGFSEIVKDIIFENQPNEEANSKFKSWIQDFVNLSGHLGFSWSEVVNSYWRKWKINFERQNSGKY